MVNAEENLAEFITNTGKDLVYFSIRLYVLRKLAYKQLSQGNIVGHETKARADELAFSFSKMTEIDLEDESAKLMTMLRVIEKPEINSSQYSEGSVKQILRARGIPEKVVEKISKMYSDDLQAAYEKGVRQ